MHQPLSVNRTGTIGYLYSSTRKAIRYSQTQPNRSAERRGRLNVWVWLTWQSCCLSYCDSSLWLWYWLAHNEPAIKICCTDPHCNNIFTFQALPKIIPADPAPVVRAFPGAKLRILTSGTPPIFVTLSKDSRILARGVSSAVILLHQEGNYSCMAANNYGHLEIVNFRIRFVRKCANLWFPSPYLSVWC